MRPALLVVLASVALGAPAAAEGIVEARDTTYGPNVLLLNAGDLVIGGVTLEYERALTPWFGLSLSVWASTYRNLFLPADRASALWIGPEFSPRFHFLRDAPGGWWVGPTVSAGGVYASDGGPVTQPLLWGAGLAAGYTFILGHHFTVQLGLGGGFTLWGERVDWVPRLRVAVGPTF